MDIYIDIRDYFRVSNAHCDRAELRRNANTTAIANAIAIASASAMTLLHSTILPHPLVSRISG
jgi:hypothetical protein